MKEIKTNEQIVKGEIARQVHKDFFDRCKNAIDNKFYLEAIFMEYSAIEARLKIILTLLNINCAGDYDTNHSVGISTKIGCLLKFIENDKRIFENSKFTRSDLAGFRRWLGRRDNLTHALYMKTEKYSKSMSKNGKSAIEGYRITRLFYDETERLKRLKKKHPEYFENSLCKCIPEANTCIEFTKQLENKMMS